MKSDRRIAFRRKALAITGALIFAVLVGSLAIVMGPTIGSPAPSVPPEVAKVEVVELRRIEDLCCPTWFALDGRRYFIIDNSLQLWLHSIDASINQKLVDGVLSAHWAPDGTGIIYVSQAPGPTFPLTFLDITTSQSRALGITDNPWRLSFDALGRMAVSRNNRIHVADLRLSQELEVPGVESRANDVMNFVEFQISPDGQKLALMEGTELSIVDLTTGQKVFVTNKIDSRRWSGFAWSPDGKELAFSTVPDPLAPPELWLINSDASNARKLLAEPGGRAGVFSLLAWLPGTRLIVYQFLPHGTEPGLFSEYQVVSADGGAAKTLFTNGLGLRLSPDGHVISFIREPGGQDQPGSWIAILSY